ncbi:MAG TPA: DUF2085 domain-containing protein [Bacteroidota bacterium]|nr:DUF2085 domain-containing protein [Bacteroidota bacterium]
MNSSRRVYFIFLILVAGWCSLILAAPMLQSFSGQTQPLAALLYRFFSRICHQLAERSFQFNGHPWAVCIRCSSIYGGFLFGLLLFPLLQGFAKRRIPSRAWLLLACLPMIVDVALGLSGIHQSNVWTRLVTGLLFGVAAPFYLLPPLFEAVAQYFSQFSTRKGDPLYARKTE